MEAAEILLIILAVALSLFLVLAITFVSYLIVVMRKIDRITDKAEDAASTFYEFSKHVKKAVKPTIVSGALVQIAKKFMNSRKED